MTAALPWRQPIDGQYERAAEYVGKFQLYALRNQNSNGSWSRHFFRYAGTSRNHAAALRSTGRILEWLAFSLPEEKLEDPRVIKAVEYVTSVLETERYSSDVASLPSAEIASAMHATNALVIYDRRVFKPADPPKDKEPVRTAALPDLP